MPTLVVRSAHIALFMLASRDDAALRRSVLGLAGSTAVGVGLLVAASFTGGGVQLGLWGIALLLDLGGPFLFGADGWKLVPGHFAERHGAIIIIALGESIVAIGAGAKAGVDAGVVAAAVLGMVVAGAMWWLYFDVVAIVAERRLAKASRGPRAQRDRPRLLLLPALPHGRRHRARRASASKRRSATSAIRSGSCPPRRCSAAAALYLLAHVAFRWRNVHTLNRQRLVCAGLLVALLAAEAELKPPSLATLGVLAARAQRADRSTRPRASPSCATASATSSRARACRPEREGGGSAGLSGGGYRPWGAPVLG